MTNRHHLTLALLLQTAIPTATDTSHFAYQRSVLLPTGTAGPACVVLDATTFAHAASRSADDLRLFTLTDREVPYILTESGVEPASTETLPALNPHLTPTGASFYLSMPDRPYSEIDLRLPFQNFIGTATVSRVRIDFHTEAPLGTFPIFDLTAQGLGRSTRLSLEETQAEFLHIQVRLYQPGGRALPTIPLTALQGADVPPSREAQTVYTTVAQTNGTATISVPAHVPIERLTVDLDPAFHGSFLRTITVNATSNSEPQTRNPIPETLTGIVSQVELPALPGIVASTYRHLSLDTPLAANLRSPATVTISIADGQPLPIRAIRLEMRQRSLCFTAASADTYVLRYGDDALPAPVYTSVPAAKSPFHTARLGPEQPNPNLHGRALKPLWRRLHPDWLWIALFAGFALFAARLRERNRPQPPHLQDPR